MNESLVNDSASSQNTSVSVTEIVLECVSWVHSINDYLWGQRRRLEPVNSG